MGPCVCCVCAQSQVCSIDCSVPLPCVAFRVSAAARAHRANSYSSDDQASDDEGLSDDY